jgi:hypothetical protein
MSGETSVGQCHLCGRALEGGICPHCDRGRDSWAAHASGLIRLHDGFWLPVLAVLAVTVAIGVIAVAFVRVRPQVGSTPIGTADGSSRGGATTKGVPVPAASTFWVLGAGTEESGDRSRFGYAFVIRTGTETSDLLTDYDLVVGPYVRGDRTVELGLGDQSYTATIVAVSPDPHVALLRIGGRFPALGVSFEPPVPGDTVVLGEDNAVPAPRATVVRSQAGHSHHLAFSVAIDGRDDGIPVLDLSGRVVGIAEPSAPFGTDHVGFAIPIRAACLAVRAC